MRTVVGTLLAERLLDIGLLLVIFVVVGYGLLGEVGGDKVEIVLLAAAGVAVAAVVAYLLVRRSERIMGFLAPIASATLGLRRAHHGLRLLGITMVIWSARGVRVDGHRRRRRLRDDADRGPLHRRAVQHLRDDPLRARVRRNPGCGRDHRDQGARGDRARRPSPTS